MKNTLRNSNIGFTKWCVALIAAGWMGAAQAQSDLVITGIIDAPRTGGLPKAIEIYVINSVADLSIYKVQSYGNGGTTPSAPLALTGSATAGQYLYVASESPEFTAYFGFAPTVTGSVLNVNGDDVVALTKNDTVVDVFGTIGVRPVADATFNYQDTWFYRKSNTAPSPTFNLADWTFPTGQSDALDSLGSSGVNPAVGNALRMPIGTFTSGSGGTGPTISGFSPSSGAVGTSVTISGSNFSSPTVKFSGTAATITVSTATSITATVPSGATTGKITVEVAGQRTATSATDFTVTEAGAAAVSVTGGTLTAFSTVVGTASAAQSFTVAGSNLTSAITVTAPTGFEVSTDAASYASSKTLTQVSGTVAATTISVRIAASTAAGTLASANVTVEATGVTTANVAVSGTVTTPALTLVLDPTTVAESAGTSASTGTVGIPASLSSNLVVNLVSTNTAAATVPVSVTIPTGQTSATFPIAAVANSSSYGSSTTAIEASNSNYTTASATLTVTNVDVPNAPLATKGWINEFHYDNTGTDSGEFVEIVLADTTPTTNVSVVLYNGGTAGSFIPYGTASDLASFTKGVSANGYTIYSKSFPVDGIQNGGTDGIALIIDNVVEEFISYEGSAVATSGAAAGYTSKDIGISQEPAGAAGGSLYRYGPGSVGRDFAWAKATVATPGQVNAGQNLGATGVQGTGTLAIANGTASSAFVTQNIFPKATAGQTVSLTLTGTLSSGMISSMSVVVPAAFTGLSLGNVVVSGTGAGAAVKALSGSTLTITGLVVDQLNPVTINIAGLTTPETAGDVTKDGNYPFTVQTGVEGNTQAMLLPTIAVVTIPIANLGDVDASGVSLDEGKTVAVQGVCTEENFNSTSSTSAYLQSGQPDGILKAGINIYSGQKILFVGGAEYVVTGSVLNYSGLTELVVAASSQVVRLGTTTTVLTPVTLTIAQLTAAHEAYEGSLVRVTGLSKVSGTWALNVSGAFPTGANIILASGGVNLTARLNVGSTALIEPIYPTAITGIYGQFAAGPLYTGGGQIQPRNQADIQDAPGLRLSFAEGYLYESTNPVGGGTIVSGALTVSRTGADTSAALVVALSASPTGLLQFPASVTIPAGQESASVTVEAIDNSAFDAAGFTNVTLTGSALGSGLSNGSTTVMILEDEASAPADTIKPGIALIGDNPLLLANGATYTDLGAKVTDNLDAERTITGSGTVNTAVQGDYTVTYNATDAAGNAADAVTRTVRVAAPLGTTYSSWLNGASASDAALLDYVFGATAPGALAASLKPTVAVTGGYLVLTYYVREGTVGLTVTPKTSSDLALGAGGWSTAEDVAEVATTTVNGVSVRKHTARVLVSGVKKFLRIQAVQQ